MTAPELFTADEAAEYLGITRRAVYSRVKAGTLRLARVEHAKGARPERIWFTEAALAESERVTRAPAVTAVGRSGDNSIAAALKGAYRGPKLSDEHTAATYAAWVQARRRRLGGAQLTF